MQTTRLIRAVHDAEHVYVWPSGHREAYPEYIEYKAVSARGEHTVRIGFGRRETYGQDRVRVVVWMDGYPRAEFFGADDFDTTGEVLCVIKVGKKECRYQEDAIPERYAMFNIVGLPTRVTAKGVHNAWAIVANVADHKTMAALGGLRVLESDG